MELDVKQAIYRNIITCQSIIRGYLYRLNRLPNVMYSIQKFLLDNEIKIYDKNEDGRINSCMDEESIIKILIKEYGERIYKPKKRMWYDILVYDYIYNWIPINIKSTTTKTSDNIGNLAICVHSYTNHELDLYKSYQNGIMSKILIEKIRKKKYNMIHKKDYYFIIINKNNKDEVIVNSIKGLNELTPNINNIPFQVCWSKNKEFEYKSIDENITMLLNALKKPKPSWKEKFMCEIRKL